MKLNDLKNITSISNISALLEYNSSLVLVSPLSVWDIVERNFRNPTNTLVKIFKNDKGELFFDDMGMFHNVESFLRHDKGRQITNNVTFGHSNSEIYFGKVTTVLNYLVNKKVNFYFMEGDSYFFPEIKEELKEKYKKVSEFYQGLVNFYTDLDDRKHEVYDKKGNFKYKNFNNTYILRNTSSGSDVFYWQIDKTLYKLGGTHLHLTDKRVVEENDRWGDGMSSGKLTWSNWSPESGYNKSFSIRKAGVKKVKAFAIEVYEFLSLCDEINKLKSLEMKKMINNGLV